MRYSIHFAGSAVVHKRLKFTIWLPLFVALCIGLPADRACGNAGSQNRSPADNDLLQFMAGGHIMGFGQGMIYLVNTSGFVRVEFPGANDVSPIAAAAESERTQDAPGLPRNGSTVPADLQQVEYRSLWNGITLRYDGVREGIAESTYFVEPGADAADIRLRYNAAVELLEDGSLRIDLSSGNGYLTESKPVAWQVVDDRRIEVQVAYAVQEGTVGFRLGKYDREHELIIDPTYRWHTFFGSAAEDNANAVAVDKSGNIYVAGRSAGSWLGPDNTPPLNPHQGAPGNIDIMILKLDSSGAYQWHTFYGSATDLDDGNALAVDGDGSVYVTGVSGGAWQGPGNTDPLNPFQGVLGFFDIMVLKLDSEGAYQWHTFLGSENHDFSNAIVVDGSGSSYVTGYSHATWSVLVGGMTFRPPIHAHSGKRDIMAVKLDSSGHSVWHTFHGSAEDDQGNDIARDQSGNLFIAGSSKASWLGPGNEEPKYPYTAASDITGLKLNGSGEYIGHSFFGSAEHDSAYGIVIGASGNIYMTGYSNGAWGSPVHPFTPGLSEIVVFGVDSSGTLLWNTFHGSAEDDTSYDMALDENENIYITGTSHAAWGNPASPHNGLFDIVTCRLSPGGSLLWHAFHGSADEEYGQGIAANGNGSILVAGSGYSSWGSPIRPYSGDADIFVMKLQQFYWPMFLPAVTNKSRALN